MLCVRLHALAHRSTTRSSCLFGYHRDPFLCAPGCSLIDWVMTFPLQAQELCYPGSKSLLATPAYSAIPDSSPCLDWPGNQTGSSGIASEPRRLYTRRCSQTPLLYRLPSDACIPCVLVDGHPRHVREGTSPCDRDWSASSFSTPPTAPNSIATFSCCLQRRILKDGLATAGTTR